MGFRDRFYTPTTAKAILSWRILLGVGAAGAAVIASLSWPIAVVAGAATYAGSVLVSMPRGDRRPRVDPFAVQEPWRQFVQGAQRSASRLRATVESTDDGPLNDRMSAVREKVEHGVDETWRIARRGNELDAAVRSLDPTALRSKLATLELRAEQDGSADVRKAIESVESQLATTDRLKEQSLRTSNTLRLVQTRLDELVARAAEISVGAGDTEAYEHDVEDLVVQLEGIRLAVEEIRTA